MLALRSFLQLDQNKTASEHPVFKSEVTRRVQIVGFPNVRFEAAPLPATDSVLCLSETCLEDLGYMLTTPLHLEIEGLQVLRPVKEITQPRNQILLARQIGIEEI